MKKLTIIKKQAFILFVLSIAVSIFLIVHGIFFDLDFSQIKRLTIEGFILTFFVVFPLIVFLEWIFDLNNKKKFKEIEKRISKIEKSKKK